MTSYWDEKHSEGTEAFQKQCMDVGHRLASKGAMMIMVCVDGSNSSDQAFKSALNMRRKFDHVNVFHAFRANDQDLQPAFWRHKALQTKYECELIGHIPKSLWSMAWVDRDGESVNTVLHRNVDPEHFDKYADQPSQLPGAPDLIILGHHGRKGPKERKAAIGTTADQALRLLHYPCLIVKTLVPTGPRNIIMAVNDSSASKRGFDILMRFVNPRDTLTLVHFTHAMEMDPVLARQKNSIREYYEKELQDIGPASSSFAFVEFDQGIPVPDAVVEYVNNSEADLFAIAPRASKDRSSITEAVVNGVLVSVLLCKN